MTIDKKSSQPRTLIYKVYRDNEIFIHLIRLTIPHAKKLTLAIEVKVLMV
jgi:hypothetical protein